jgi:hypothetical protein
MPIKAVVAGMSVNLSTWSVCVGNGDGTVIGWPSTPGNGHCSLQNLLIRTSYLCIRLTQPFGGLACVICWRSQALQQLLHERPAEIASADAGLLGLNRRPVT